MKPTSCASVWGSKHLDIAGGLRSGRFSGLETCDPRPEFQSESRCLRQKQRFSKGEVMVRNSSRGLRKQACCRAIESYLMDRVLVPLPAET